MDDWTKTSSSCEIGEERRGDMDMWLDCHDKCCEICEKRKSEMHVWLNCHDQWNWTQTSPEKKYCETRERMRRQMDMWLKRHIWCRQTCERGREEMDTWLKFYDRWGWTETRAYSQCCKTCETCERMRRQMETAEPSLEIIYPVSITRPQKELRYAESVWSCLTGKGQLLRRSQRTIHTGLCVLFRSEPYGPKELLLVIDSPGRCLCKIFSSLACWNFNKGRSTVESFLLGKQHHGNGLDELD